MPAPDLQGLEHDVRTLGWVLIVDGVEPEWDDRQGTHTAGTDRTAEGGIVSASPSTQSIDLDSRVIKGGDITVRLASTSVNTVADVLGRVTPRGAARSSRLAVAVAQTPLLGATVEVSESIAAWPATGVLWVGQEAMEYTARTVVAPYQFTVPVGGRAFYGSPCQAHQVGVGDGLAPMVTDSCVSWRGRPAALRVAEVHQLPDGSWVWGDLVDEVRGFLDGSPQRLGDGTYELTIVPWHAKIDVDVFGSALETRLQLGWHVFDGTNALRTTLHLKCERGAVFRRQVMGGSAGVVLDGVAWYVWNAWCDTTLDATHLPGRRGPVNLVGQPGTWWATTPGGFVGAPGVLEGPGVNQVNLTAAPAVVPAEQWVVNAKAVDQRTVNLTTLGAVSALQWPGQALQAINAAAGWAPPSPAGATGLWVNTLVAEDAGGLPGGAALSGRPALSLRLTFDGPQSSVVLQWFPMLNAFGFDTPDLWYGLDLSHPSEAVSGIVLPGGFGDLVSVDGDRVAVVAPGREITVTATPQEEDDQRQIEPIRGIADAFWQTGERYILVEEDVFPSTLPFDTSVRWTDPNGVAFATTIRVIDKKSATSVVAGVPGYLLEVDPVWRYRAPSFGSWRGVDAILAPRVAWQRESPTLALLDLLSGGTPGSVLPDGANIPIGYIDTESFYRFPAPAGRIGEWSHEVVGETSLLDLVVSILRQLDAALTERLDPETGIRKLTLVPLGLPALSMSEETIDEGDWSVDDVVGTWDERLVNARQYTMRRGMSGGRGLPEPPALTVTMRDIASIAQYGEQSGGEVELFGVDPDSPDPETLRATLLPLFSSETGAMGDVRLLVRGTIAAQQALRLYPGAVVTLSCDTVPGFDAQPLSGAVGRVTSLDRDQDASTCAIEVMCWPSHGAGIAPALRITDAPAVNQVTIVANYYAPTTNPLTGAAQVDSDLFAPGDSTRLYTMDGTLVSSPTILTIVGATVTFTGAHGLPAATPAYLSGPVAILATPTLRSYAYLGTDAGLAGSVAVDVYT